jgi:hypothetical protein
MTARQPAHQSVPFPRLQPQMVDWLERMHRQHAFHALLELDVTDARAAIRAYRARTATGLRHDREAGRRQLAGLREAVDQRMSRRADAALSLKWPGHRLPAPSAA